MFFRFVLVILGPDIINRVYLIINICHGTRSEIFVLALIALKLFTYLGLTSLLSEAAFSLLVVSAVEQISVLMVVLI